jgi:S1/P1 Nuclease
MKKALTCLFVASLLLLLPARAQAWHDQGHMIVAQIAYLRLTPAAKARVDRLLVPQPNRRPLIHLCAGYYTAQTCEKTYDPVTIAVWMDDFRGDSLNDEYDPWHYINYRPVFDGIPVRTNVGPLPTNVLDRINWCVNTLRAAGRNDKRDAETLGFLYHLVGDVHQPLHAATRYSAKNPDGDAGGNGFSITYPPDSRVRNLHFFWDAAAGRFGTDAPRRPLDEKGRALVRQWADELIKEHPFESMPEARETQPLVWVEESNRLAREFAYAKVAEGGTPSAEYVEETKRIAGRRIALAGYRLAEVLNALFVEAGEPATPQRRN